MSLCFGDFTYSPGTRTLLRLGFHVHLTSKAFRLLDALLERRPNAVAKSELVRQLWPDAVVSEGNLANLVVELRRRLGDDEQGAYVRTAHGFGYAFVADVQVVADAVLPELAARSRFRLIARDRDIGLLDGETWIGRSPECRVQVHCAEASRRHARIVISDGRATLEDGPSRHGTFLQGKLLAKPAVLQSGDRIAIGTTRLTFQIFNPDAPTD